MTKASPGAMPPPNASMTAAVEAGKAPMWSGNTTCCATTSPRAFSSAQDASCDSRTMVEKPVRNSEFCISCTMPERLAFITSSSMASIDMGSARQAFLCRFLRYDQVLPFIDARRLPRTDNGRAIKLFEDRGSGNVQAHIEPLALIDRAVERAAVERDAPRRALRAGKRGAGSLELRHFDRRHEAGAAHAVGYDLDRLLRRHVAEHAFVLLVEGEAQLLQV